MREEKKSVLNVSFFGFALTGFALIYYSEEIVHEYAFFLPVGLVAVYAAVTYGLLKDCDDHALAEHHLDSIYFLGFLFTLVSLIILFYRMRLSLPNGESGEMIFQVFHYVGVSVSTSLAGVLLRSIARGQYLKDHPDTVDHMEKSYLLLETIAESFSTQYRETVDAIRLFLQEREENARVLSKKERQYLESLGHFVEATNGFSTALSEAERTLTGRLEAFSGVLQRHTDGVEAFNRMSASFAVAAEGIRREAEGAPLAAVNKELESFRTGVGELNEVLDSLITILETKVERAG